jgi:hypothetical protein
MKRRFLVQKVFALASALVILYALSAINVGRPAQMQANLTQQQPQKRLRWYKGNTHTHTVNSDGDSTPDEVTRWYREQDYNFLVLTDHNFLTKVDALNALHGADEQFIVIRGEEVSDKFDNKSVHINALDIERVVEPQGGKTLLDTIQRNVNAIRAARGVPHINHPNFGWVISAEELKQVENNKLFEIFNGHPQVNNFGGGGKPGLEEMWDAILSSGKLLYGIAVDDAHNFKTPWDKRGSRPGQGWVVVRAEKLTPAAILEAMERGDFYASTGVELTDYQASEKSITITIRETGSTKHRVQFIGKGGRIGSEAITNPAVYQIRGDEGYVRAKVIDSNGKVAWTQPVMLGAR